MTVEAKCCPFCSSTRLRTPGHNRGGLHTNKWFVLSVRCLDCGAQGPVSRVQQFKADGTPYAHGSKRPKRDLEAQIRWDMTVDEAVDKAISLWNGNR